MPGNILTRFCYLVWCWTLLAGFVVWTAIGKGWVWVVGTVRGHGGKKS